MERKKGTGEADESALLIGKTLGTFQIAEIVGKGGMGVVYRANDRALNRTVALKVLSPELRDQTFLQRFVREARIAAKLDHPHIVHVYTIASADAGLAGTRVWYIAMQYVEGKTIASYLQGNHRFSSRKALLVARYVADALRVAHEAGIIHRDIKPNNIMIDRQGKVKVMDFGLARSIIRSASVTQTGTYLGTPTYSSPEQCESSEIDGRSDIYSLGVVLYEMLSGRVPYEAETPFAIFKKIVDEDPIPLEKLNPTLSPQTIRFVQQMMAKKREDRYQTMAEVIRDIDLLLKTEIAEPETDEKRLAAAPTPAPHTPVDGKKLRTPARHRRLFVQRKRAPAWMAFGSIAALALIAVVGYLLIANKTISSPKPPVSRESTPKTADAPATPAKLPEKLTALIFDFQNLSPQEESRWLEIAISDLLIADLSQCDGLNVVSRINLLEGAKKIAGKRITLAEEDRVTLRKELGGAIDHLRGDIAVQGSFYIQEGKKIRIVASLFRCENGKLADWGTCQVDGENYEEGLLALVDALSIKIADAIRKRGADLKVASAERLTFDGGRPIGELMASLPATADKSRERKLADGLKEQDKAQRGRSEGFFGTAKAEVEGRSAAPGDAKPAAAGGVAQDPKKNDDDLTAEAGKSVSALAKDKAELQEEKAGEAKGDGNLMETLRARYRQLWEKEAVEFPR